MLPQDQYVRVVVARKSPASIAPGSLNSLVATVKTWAHRYLLELKPSGSYAKGTAVAGSADIDLLISLHNGALSGATPDLATLYHSLNAWLAQAGYVTALQNVSIRVMLPSLRVDLVPAVKHSGNTNDHSIFKRRGNTWRKTNIDMHVNAVQNSGRILEIKAVKIWRNIYGLDFPSFYLELATIEALKGKQLYIALLRISCT